MWIERFELCKWGIASCNLVCTDLKQLSCIETISNLVIDHRSWIPVRWLVSLIVIIYSRTTGVHAAFKERQLVVIRSTTEHWHVLCKPSNVFLPLNSYWLGTEYSTIPWILRRENAILKGCRSLDSICTLPIQLLDSGNKTFLPLKHIYTPIARLF